MYQLLIVEDEKWEREGLRDFLDWESMGIGLVCCACDGEEGLRLAELRRPDIIIADIKMPKMNGLQMLKLVCALLPEVKIIILSGYDDFQYARQAIGLHACAYILKPVERGCLEEALCAALDSLAQEKTRSLELGKLERRWAEYVDSRKDHVLFDSLELGSEFEALGDASSAAGGDGARAVAIAAFYRRPGPTGAPVPCSLETDRGLLGEIKARIQRSGARVSFGEHFYEAVLLMESRDERADFDAELHAIGGELWAEFGVGTIVALGGSVFGDSDIFQSYAQAKVASSYRFVCACGDVLPFRALSNGERDCPEDARALILSANEAIERAVRSGGAEREACCALIDDFLSRLRDNYAVSKMLVGYFLLEACRAIGAPGDADLSSLSSLEQTRQRLYSAVDAIAERPMGGDARRCAPMCRPREEEIVRCVLGIVERRYSEELDLSGLAEEVHLSPYYLGSLFKKRTGKNFSQYLVEYRLEAAREMLKEKSTKLGDLSDAIGIHNPSYFSALFKKRFGISPVEYRRIEQGRI
jgi:two-component system response regulator YesN